MIIIPTKAEGQVLVGGDTTTKEGMDLAEEVGIKEIALTPMTVAITTIIIMEILVILIWEAIIIMAIVGNQNM